jgi:hypothetical protein
MKFFIISDCHGNIEGLQRALEKKKLVDGAGNRLVGKNTCIVSIGDLANCVEDSWIGDIACLSLVGEVIDTMLIGNHEIPYLDERNFFRGFHFVPEIHKKILDLISNDLIGAAYQIGNTLITHAGLSRDIMSLDMGIDECFQIIEENWENKNYNHSWFSSVGMSRGGRNNTGGILWCDFENEFMPTGFPQIVGHTPRYVRMKDNALCIDVGAKNPETEPFILEIS